MSKLLALFLISQSLFMLTGCESSGTIRGVSDGQAVKMKYKQNLIENEGKLSVTLQTGETFTGKFVQKSSTSSGNALGIGQSTDEDKVTINDSTTISSLADAVLIGNKGHTMHCKFQLSAPDIGIDGGGIGSCKTSTGKTIQMTF